MFLLGIASHAPRCGKTTAANHLVEKHGFTLLSVGDLVKAEVAAMLSTHGITYSEAMKEEFRSLLTSWGLLRMRLSGTDYWNEKLAEQLERYVDRSVVVPDIRTLEDVAMIRSRGGALLLVRRPRIPLSADPMEGQLSQVRFDLTLDNSSEDGGRSMFAQLDDAAARFWRLT